MYCPNCGHPNRDDAKFCANCGTMLAEAPYKQTPSALDRERGGLDSGGRHPKSYAGKNVPSSIGTRSKTPRIGKWVCALVLCALVAGALLFMVFRGEKQSVPQGLAIDESTFPDEVLRNQIAMVADLDGDGWLIDEELAALRVLHVTGARQIAGLEVLTALEELSFEGEELESVEVSNMPALTSIHGENVPNLRKLSVTHAPQLEEVVIVDADCLEEVIFDDTDNLVTIDVPRTTSVEGDIEAALVDCYLVKNYSKKIESSSGWSSETVVATYDSEGRMLTLDHEQDTSAAIPAPNTLPFSATMSYSEDGLLQEIKVSSPDSWMDGTWEVTYSEDYRRVSYAFLPSSPSDGSRNLFRTDVYSETGMLLERTFDLYDDEGHPKGKMFVEYDDSGQPIKVTGTYNSGQSIDGAYEVVNEYDGEGRLVSTTETQLDSDYARSSFYDYDAEGHLASDSRHGWITTYAYDSSGHLMTASRDDTLSQASFETNEQGLITSATINQGGVTVTTYTVEYEVVKVFPNNKPMSAMDLTLPLIPAYDGVPWRDCWWYDTDFLRMNQEWLALQADNGKQGVLETEKNSSTVSANGEMPTAYLQVLANDGHPTPKTAHAGSPNPLHYYALDDLDGNGIPELIISYGDEQSSASPTICAIWTIDGSGSGVCLLDHPYRGGLSVLADGTVRETSSSSAFDWHDWYWRIEGDQAQKTISFDHAGTSDNQSVDTYYSNEDEGIENQVISDGEHDAFVASLDVRDSYDWRPVAE